MAVQQAVEARAPSAASEFRSGWPVVLAAAYGTAVGAAGVLSYPTPYFMQPLQDEFGWSRTGISFAVSLGTLGLALSGPLAGRLCDRFGVRRVIPASIVLVSLALASLSLVGGEIAVFYGVYVVMAVGGGATGFGCYTRAVAGNFDRARGMALGLSLTGTGLMAFTAPLLLPPVIAEHGWRAGYLALAGAALLALAPALVFLREPRAAHQEGTAEFPGLSAKDVLRTRQFWFLFAAGALTTAVVTGTQLHGMAMLTDMGVPRGEAQRNLALYGAGMIVARILVGFVIDRVHASRVAIVLFLLPTISLTLLGLGWRDVAVFTLLTVAAVAAGEGDLMGFMTSRYFGLKAYAEVFGWLISAFCIGGMAGATLAGVIYDVTGDYRLWLFGSAIACLVVTALLGSLGRYRWEAERR